MAARSDAVGAAVVGEGGVLPLAHAVVFGGRQRHAPGLEHQVAAIVAASADRPPQGSAASLPVDHRSDRAPCGIKAEDTVVDAHPHDPVHAVVDGPDRRTIAFALRQLDGGEGPAGAVEVEGALAGEHQQGLGPRQKNHVRHPRGEQVGRAHSCFVQDSTHREGLPRAPRPTGRARTAQWRRALRWVVSHSMYFVTAGHRPGGCAALRFEGASQGRSSGTPPTEDPPCDPSLRACFPCCCSRHAP